MALKSVFLAAVLSALAPSAFAADKVLLRVNGAPVMQSEALERAWKAGGTQVVNQMVDEILVEQEARALGVKVDRNEVERRVARVRAQFKDAAAFKAGLGGAGSSLKELKARLEEQVLREALVVRAENISVTDEEVKAFFASNKVRLGAPAAYRLRQVVVGTEKEAGDFLVALRAGSDFADLASRESLDAASKDKGGDLGFVSASIMVEPVRKEIARLKPGEIGDPIRTDAGFHLIKLEGIRPAKPAVFSDMRAGIKAAILTDKINKAWPPYLAGLRARAKVGRE